MPSNALKLSQYIERLQSDLATHGDVDVVFANDGRLIALDGRNQGVSGEAFGQRLPEPVMVIGLQRDEQGRVRNSPGAVYVASADAGEWNYDRRFMPEGADVTVWKRDGGRDIGRREGERYFVREGASEWPRRPVEIIPAGILGWKP